MAIEFPIIYLVPKSPSGSIGLPTALAGRATRRVKDTYSLFDLSTREVYPAIAVTNDAVGSYPTFSPLPQQVGAVRFLWHWLSAGKPAAFRLGSTALCVARTFLPEKQGDKTTCCLVNGTKFKKEKFNAHPIR